MPIYAYRCERCGFEKDVLRKMSDPLLVDCPSCGEPTFRKQVTAAGFQLKGSGWYVTDFRDSGKKDAKGKKDEGAAAEKSGGEVGADSGGDAGNQPAGGEKAAPTDASADGKSAGKNADQGGGAAAASPAPAPAPAPPAAAKSPPAAT